MLPFEEELGGHPGFEAMRIHVAKEHKRPAFPVNMKQNEATQLLRETIEECWDTDSEARLSAVCVEERFKDVDNLMEAKCEFSCSLVMLFTCILVHKYWVEKNWPWSCINENRGTHSQ